MDVALSAHNLLGRVRELPESTATAAEAARAIGCDVRQIVKTLLFRTRDSSAPVLVLSSGAHRVDEAWMAHYAGEPLVRADPEYVRSVTGFAIGGVPPVGLTTPLSPLIDYDLLELREIWAAAGHPRAVCRLTPAELLRITRGRPVSVVPLRHDDGGPWVTFDCYGTLVDWRAGLLGQFRRIVAERADVDPEGLFERYLREEKVLEAGSYQSYRDVVAEAAVRAAQGAGVELAPNRAREIPQSIPEWPPFDDTRTALATLTRNGFRIAVLSNIDTDLLKQSLARLGVQPDCLVTAEDVRSYKPAWAHWIRFLKQTGTRPEDVWHVSASYEYDVEPARSLGFRTVFVERYGKSPVEEAAELTVPGLTELAQRVSTKPPPVAGGG